MRPLDGRIIGVVSQPREFWEGGGGLGVNGGYAAGWGWLETGYTAGTHLESTPLADRLVRSDCQVITASVHVTQLSPRITPALARTFDPKLRQAQRA